jgi:hypothetical protein
MTDVSIVSPQNSQVLTYDSSSSKWHNTYTIYDPVIGDHFGSAQWDFGNGIMTLNGTQVFSFAAGGTTNFEVLSAFYDAGNYKSLDVNQRQIYAPDGSTVLVDWGTSSLRIPNLTTNGYVTTTGGNGTLVVGSGPTGGGVTGAFPTTTSAVPTWGDTSGKTLTDSRWIVSGSTLTTQDTQNSNAVGITIQNQSSGNAAQTQTTFINDESLAKLALYSSGFAASGIVSSGDLELKGPGTGTRNIVIDTPGKIRFSNDGGATESFAVTRVGFGGRTSIVSTVDQTATAETVHQAYTVPAGSAAAGTTFRIHASGNADNGTAAITFTPSIRWGGVGGTRIISVPTFTSSTTANTNRAWVLDASVTIRTAGSFGTAVAEQRYIERTTSATGVETVHADNSGATAITVDTISSSNDLVLTWTLSSATGAPHLRTISGTIEVVKP